jgi:hypothetical protein
MSFERNSVIFGYFDKILLFVRLKISSYEINFIQKDIQRNQIELKNDDLHPKIIHKFFYLNFSKRSQ